MTSKWRDWQPGHENISKRATNEPSKPTKPGFDGFDGSYLGPSGIFSFDSITQTTIDAACNLLNSVEARLWVDSAGNAYVGVWSCVDSDEVRQAAALVFPNAKIIHLERPEVPLQLKAMSSKIASIENARQVTP